MRTQIISTFLFGLLSSVFAMQASAADCPVTHPYSCGSGCYEDAQQAASIGCTNGSDTNDGSDSDNNGDNNNGNNNDNSNGTDPDACPVQGRVESGCFVEGQTQDWCDTTCVTWTGNGNDGCLNAAGQFVTRSCVCADPENAIESIIDIEVNLGIDIDDEFVAQADYIGEPPPLDPSMTKADALVYFKALLKDDEQAQLFADTLDEDNDGILTRNEASAVKGSDPLQTLNTNFGCGLSTDDVLAYVGLYFGDGSIDKYQGNLDSSVLDNLLEFTRSWQPGTSALGCAYRGDGDCSTEGDNNSTDSRVGQGVDTDQDGDTSTNTNTSTGTQTETDTGTQTQTDTDTGDDTVSPAPTPTQDTMVEAESGQILGSASVYNDNAASGGRGVAYLDTLDSGFSINPAPQSTGLEIYFASQNNGTISVVVNGNVTKANFVGNGTWTGNYGMISVDIDIPASAVVEIKNTSGDQAMNVDRVVFKAVTDDSPTDTGTSTGTSTGSDTTTGTDTGTGTATGTSTGTSTGTDTGTGGTTDLKGRNIPAEDKVLFIMGQDTTTLREFLPSVQSGSIIAPGGVTLYSSFIDAGKGDNSVYITGIEGPPYDNSNGEVDFRETLDAYDAAAGKKVAVSVGLYLSDEWADCGNQPLRAIAGTGEDDVGSPSDPTSMSAQWRNGVDRMITWFKNEGRPVYLRIGFEFDGPWNCYNQDFYKQTFRYFKERINALGATNVATVWQAATYPDNGDPTYNYDVATNANHYEDWWPGADVVDWVGISFFAGNEYEQYQWSCQDQSKAWTIPDSTPRALQDALAGIARKYGKPVQISESAPQGYELNNLEYSCVAQHQTGKRFSNGQQAWDSYFVDYFNWIESNKDVVRAFSYINTNWQAQDRWFCASGADSCEAGFWGDTRLQANGTVLNNFASKVSETGTYTTSVVVGDSN